jgi:pilus assembly protein CpaC
MSVKSPLRTSFAAVMSAAIAFTPNVVFAQSEPADAPLMRITRGGGAAATSLVLAQGKAAIIDLPADARDVLLSNPNIADAVVRTPRRVYVIGRQLGQTNAFFFDANGGQIANIEIRVEPDVQSLNEILSRHATDGQIQAEAVNGSLVLTGTVRSAADADRAMQIAQSFIGNRAAAGGGATTGAASASAASAAPEIINLIQVQGSEQVLVRVRVVEMSRTLVRQLGVNLNYEEMLNTLLPDDAFVNVLTQNGFSVNGQALGGLAASGGVAENILQPTTLAYPAGTVNPLIDPRAGPDTGNAIPGGYQYNANGTATLADDTETFGPATVHSDRRTDGAIEAFERAGLLRVLAEPNLTAISGEAARFLAGGEFPVPVSATDGAVSIEFKPFGVGLSFTPVVLSGGRISLKLATEVSELTAEGSISTGDTPIRNPDGTTTILRGFTIPALQVRRAETTVEMPSGSSIMMAGLIQERTRHVMEGVPGIMNTPVIGSLFRSRDFVNNETELVIIVTPYLVRAARPDQMRTPTDGFVNPTEGESLLTGRLNAMYRSSNEETGDRRQLQGPHGHVIE